MKTAGIIAEYNPFHMGHSYHIRKTREITKADYVIAVMSGDYVQRGEPACTDKYFRTRMALMGGADLVIELPVLYATSSAEIFASAGVTLLDKIGCVDYLSFGSEWAGLEDYKLYIKLFLDEPAPYSAMLHTFLKAGESYPLARSKAASRILSEERSEEETTAFLKEPNHILGLEYLKALSRRRSSIEPVVVIREGGGYHDGRLYEKDYSSASAIRRALVELRGSFSEDGRENAKAIPRELAAALGDQAESFIAHISRGESVCWDDLMPLLDYQIMMGHRPDNHPGYRPDNHPGYQSDNQSGYRSDNHPGYQSDDQSEYRSDNQPGDQSDSQSDNHSCDQLIYQPDDQSGLGSDNRSGYQRERSSAELCSHIRKKYVRGCSFDQLISILHSKNRTDTALKRALLHILLHAGEGYGIQQASGSIRTDHLSGRTLLSGRMLLPEPAYARILGFRRSAAPLLRQLRKESRIPIIQRTARGSELLNNIESGKSMHESIGSEDVFYKTDIKSARSVYELDIRAADLYEQTAARKCGRCVVSELARQQIIIDD